MKNIDELLRKIYISELLTSEELHILTEWIREPHERIDKAIEKYEKCKEEDYCTLALDMYDILRGEDNE